MSYMNMEGSRPEPWEEEPVRHEPSAEPDKGDAAGADRLRDELAYAIRTRDEWEANADEAERRIEAAERVLDRYSDDSDPEECAPEDRWRLYRDLRAALAGTEATP